ESVPIGEDEEDNVVAHKWGELPTFNFEVKPHWEVGTGLGILDFENASKVTGSRFVFYKGLGASLESVLLKFMMNLHAHEYSYQRKLLTYIVNIDSITGT